MWTEPKKYILSLYLKFRVTGVLTVRNSDTGIMNLSTLLIGLVVAVIIFFVLPFILMVRKARWMEKRGERIVARVTSVQHDKKRASTGATRHFYTVTATWTSPRTGQTYTFWKYFFDEDPDKSISELVPVIIDPRNPKRYEIQV